MATQRKTSRASSKKTTTTRVSRKQSELELLREQNALLQQRLTVLEAGNQSKGEVEESKIPLDDLISIVSLIPHTLNLCTKPYGQGNAYKFDGFGEVKRVLYSDVLLIIENHRNFLEAGLFMILDKRVIKAHGLQEMYAKILTKEKIEQILSGSANAVELYKSCNAKQQEEIVSMIIDRLANDPEAIDLNVVSQISRLSGIKIEEKVNDTREILTIAQGEQASA